MKIIVQAKSSAKEDRVERLTQPTLGFDKNSPQVESYKVWVRAVPVDGKANDAIMKLLAKYFNVTQSQVRLLSGRSNKSKFFEIDL